MTQREIKFRAWLNKGKRYASGYDTIMYLRRFVFLQMPNRSWWVNLAGEEQTEDIVIEQYTGLKDKNGVEIYEGDIIRTIPLFKKVGNKRFKRDKPYRNPLSVVEYDDEMAAFFEMKYGKNGFEGGGMLCDITSEWETKDEVRKHEVEVIGNIHENPELLEGEK